MKKKYKIPIQGTVLEETPLKGASNDPICPIDLLQLMPKRTVSNSDTNEEQEVEYGYSCRSITYNINEEWCEVEIEASKEFHNWLAGILPQLRGIQKEKGWKLDKSKMVDKLEK